MIRVVTRHRRERGPLVQWAAATTGRPPGTVGGMFINDSEDMLHDTSSIHLNTAGGDGGGTFVNAMFGVFTLNDASSVSDNSPDDIFDRFTY